jgi:hypothetical protein
MASTAAEAPDLSPATPPDRIVPAADTPDTPARPPQGLDLGALYSEAVALAAAAVAEADHAQAQEVNAMGARLREEQDSLYARIMAAIEPAVRDAAAKGARHAVVMRFGGSDVFSEFCYLYMLKGPHKADQREEMKAMGVKPLLARLRRELRPHGFDVVHAWQRATNDNTLTVVW